MKQETAAGPGVSKKNGLCERMRAFDALNIGYLMFLSVLALFFMNRVPVWLPLVAANAVGIFVIVMLTSIRTTSRGSLLCIIRNWYIMPLIFLVFKEVYVIIQSLNRSDFDYLLIAMDRKIFGGDPTVWLQQFVSPALTELLQIAYASYFIIMLAVGIELYIRNEGERFSGYIFTLMFGFFLSYIGYLLVPAIGPRFTLHNFATLDQELPGLWLAVPIRHFLNAGESIPDNVANPAFYAQRDVFPSGHTAMTLVALYFAAKFKLASRWYLYVAGALLIVATVYLRYHYVVDLFGGVFTMALTVAVAPAIICWWDKKRNCGNESAAAV